MTTNQAIQNLILTYLEENPDFLEIIKQKFITKLDNPEILLVDSDTEQNIGLALENFRQGNYTS